MGNREKRTKSGERIAERKRTAKSEACKAERAECQTKPDFSLRSIPHFGLCSQAKGTVALVPVFTAFEFQ